MSDTTHQGSCQCGAVRYEVEGLDLESTFTCNCSRCERLGSVLAFVPREQFELLSGEAELTEYLFNKEVIAHQFCSVCGIEPFAYGQMPDGTKMAAINVNTVEGVDPRALDSKHVDGASS